MRRIITIFALSAILLTAGTAVLAQTDNTTITGARPPASLQIPSSLIDQSQVITPTTVTGAATGQTTSSNPLLLVLSPFTPKPNTLVRVSVKTSFVDFSRATIGWLEDGKLMESGLGKTSHSVLVGGVGSAVTVTAIVTLSDGTVYQKSVTIRPASVDIIWEAVSSIPPFYRGKALYSRFGMIRLTAMTNIVDANGTAIPSDRLNYEWSLNGTALGNHSGYGRNLLSISDPIYRTPFVVSVTVTSEDKSVGASGFVSIDAIQPNALVYEDSPLYGILFNNAVGGSYTMASQESSVQAYPYFFNVANRSDLTYQWLVNGQIADGFQGPSLTLRNTSGQGGVARVSLQVNNAAHIMEGSSKDFLVGFGVQ